MAKFLLDANHVGDAIRRVSVFRDRMRGEHRRGHRFGTCIPALAEVEAGLQRMPSPELHRHRLEGLFDMLRIWPLERQTAPVFGRFFNLCKDAGRVLSGIDLLLAALAWELGLVLLTTDGDFQALPMVKTENWLV